MQSAASPECIPTLEFPEIPNKDELVVSKLRVNCKLDLVFSYMNVPFSKLSDGTR